MTGNGATWHENQLVPITRNGHREDVYWTYSYSPIYDDKAPSGVGGVLVICSETTALMRAQQAEQRLNAELENQIDQKNELLESLRKNETLYRSALAAGRMGAWEVDFLDKKRIWSVEGLELFGLDLPDRVGQVGGVDDEFRRRLHPEDRYFQDQFHELAQQQDTFDAEYRIVKSDGKVVWVAGRAQVISRDPGGHPHRMINVVADITQRKHHEEHVQFLMRESVHRTKNLLAIVQSIARATGRNSQTIAEFLRAFDRRLGGLADSHDVLASDGWMGADLEEIVIKQIAPFADPTIGRRVEVSGPRVNLIPEAAQAIGLALHELATNASKYGALSVAHGRVAITWDFQPRSDARRQLRIEWREFNGPPVCEPTVEGFGSMVIGEFLAKSVEGETQSRYDPAGFEWFVTLPPNQLNKHIDTVLTDPDQRS